MENPPEEVIRFSRPPNARAKKFRSMWAFGNHFRVASAETHLRTCDSGIAATFNRPCRFGMRDMNPVTANVEYVGNVEEILEVNFDGTLVTILVCRWARAIYRGQNATIKNDRWGFTLVNFNSTITFGSERFAFPCHVEQVFYCESHDQPGWKIVLRKEVRGKRIFQAVGVANEQGIFAAGENADHEGLQVPAEVPEVDPPPARTGRNLRRAEAFATVEEEELMFDRNLGESGSSSDSD